MASNNRTYGTVPGSQNGTVNSSDEESASLLAKTTSPSFAKRTHRYFNANVSNTWGDVALLFCYIITGILDSSSVLTWGSFASMQTGNTVYIGSGIVAPHEGDRWIRASTSLGFFLLGSFFFARYHRYFSPRKRWVVVSSYTLQLAMVTIAAVMITIGPSTTPKDPITVWVTVPLALVAFQSAGQAVISRVLKFNALTSVVLTSIYCDLASDEKLFAGVTENPERNRRVLAPCLLLLGAVIGGFWAHSEVGMTGALWTAVALKAVVVLMWCFWTEEKED
ncbi:unnamed protein product [Zymoseptoria tritici ST99CH_1A5]|uniref:DUF1275 domain protein n=4 Tax=Zymoseptoria tritici TaxID=1047171 RepID=F9XMG2_ZYMTI|nr:uncharacterized protein MYCGRDRAFT_49575 [Zymoseptoria tritici IPO323]SMQ55009.1 unnamed protein product [Zymoseptoria tritici ST99CH_3D7]SMR60222.1 unnamed protein product [Zymoseptoria tritici ST99CH_1E4]SMR63333.1 unnamed protein product [Zymoseptoria tritici ST99CH_3D1]SMY28674.1 unnamed protein product [Zymoseptoria tritici ST99CH_1A5]EGP83707.1 hypothetical protein MYCGRDRAFT_49575 [Zymoseptoria tritici IPO323]